MSKNLTIIAASDIKINETINALIKSTKYIKPYKTILFSSHLNSINKKILNKIMEINISNFTEPLVIPGGYLILKVNEKRITKKDIKLEDELKKTIEIKTNKQLNQFSLLFFKKLKQNTVINEY